MNDSVEEHPNTEALIVETMPENVNDQLEFSADVNLINGEFASESFPSNEITIQPVNTNQPLGQASVTIDTSPKTVKQEQLNIEASPKVPAKKTATLGELTTLLNNLNSIQVTRKGYVKDEMQVRLDRDLTMVLRNLPAYLTLLDNKSLFHIDALVNHLLRQFVYDHKSAFNEISKQLARAEGLRQQRILESMKLSDIS